MQLSKFLLLLVICLLTACQTPVTKRQTIHVVAHAADGRLQNQLIRHLHQHGYQTSPRATTTIKLLDEKRAEQAAISGSDNITQNLWISLTVNYEIRQAKKIKHRRITESRLLRRNYNQTLASQHEQTALLRTMQSAIAERIILELTTV